MINLLNADPVNRFQIMDSLTFGDLEISKIKGQHSSKISNLLGYISKSEVIHKDDMVKV